MAEPKCSECGDSEFDCQKMYEYTGDILSTKIFIIYCVNCGHIIGVTAPGG